MIDKSELLSELYQARFDALKEIATSYDIPKSGSVETLRARLIQHLILNEWDLSPDGIKNLMNADLGEILGVFGIKKSGSIRARRQRLYLHLNHDVKQLTTDKLDDMTRDQLHAMCKTLELPLSGNKQALLVRLAGVLASQDNAWGKVKKSLRRPRGSINLPSVPSPSEEVEIPQPVFEQEVPEQEIVAEAVESFKADHPQGWTFEEETELRQELADAGIQTAKAEMSSSIDEALRSGREEVVVESPKMVQEHTSESHSLEVEASLIELRARQAEVEAAGRDYLLISSTSDEDDLQAFISSMAGQGFAVDVPAVRNEIRNIIMELDYRSQSERNAMHATPNSWREREALRAFEAARGKLRDSLDEIIAANSSDMVKARMAFENLGREIGLDLRIPSVSGRVHALFDLHVDISEQAALNDPATARRNRVLRILLHGAVHLSEAERKTLARLERNIQSFEQLVETVLESSEGVFSEAQQALVIRFLESRGYEVNTADLRPRILACAGIIGSELGFISPSEIPRVAPGIIISDNQVDAIVTELQALAAAFKPAEAKVAPEPEEQVAESVADAADHLDTVRSKIDRVDDLLARLRG